MKTFVKLISAVMAIAAVLSLAACSAGATGGGSTAESKVVRIGTPAADASQLVENAGVAYGLGYLDEELEKVGYKAEYYGFGQGGTAINEALVSNQLDLAFVGDIPSIIAKSNGLDIQIVASLNTSAEMGILAGKNSGIKSVADLKGKKVVVAFGTTTYVYMVNLLNANGMSINDVELINDIANGATLVASGDADAVVSTGVGLYLFAAGGIGDIINTSKTDPSLSSQFFVYGNTKYISANGEAIEAIIRALIRSRDKAAEDPLAAQNAIVTDDRPLPIVQQIYPAELGFDMFEPYLTSEVAEKYDSTVSILLDGGILAKRIGAADIFNTEYLDAVYKELGRSIPS